MLREKWNQPSAIPGRDQEVKPALYNSRLRACSGAFESPVKSSNIFALEVAFGGLNQGRKEILAPLKRAY